MNARTRVVTACLLSCTVFAAFAQTSVDRSFTTTAKNCDGVKWSAKALATYPTIASACQAVEERDGKNYVKFEGTVKRNANEGKQLTVNFKDGGEVTLTPPPETTLYVDGRRTPVADLKRGDKLSFYISEDRFVAQLPSDETPTAQFVAAPIAPAAPSEGDEQMAAALPATASPLPLLGLCGFIVLGAGAVLTLFRRRSSARYSAR